MGIATRLARRLEGIAYLIENPGLISLRKHGGVLGTYRDLNQSWLTGRNIATVLDIGAHTGLFAITIHTLFPETQIYAFEPLPDCFEGLQKRMAENTNFKAFNIALGDKSGSIEFERNEFTSASSCLPLTEIHTSAFPSSRKVAKTKVEMKTLDDAVRSLQLQRPLMIKIDVQGYEGRVLGGAQTTLKVADVIIIETSFEKLYEDQSLFDDVYKSLTSVGFAYHGSFDQLRHPQDGRILQQDSIFLRK